MLSQAELVPHLIEAPPGTDVDEVPQVTEISLPKAGLPKQRKFLCNEPTCKARYVHKGDLARHKREEHSDVEYLCPFPNCLWHRKGHGFKRMHRLASHLLKPGDGQLGRGHPRALSRLNAKYIAVDYNDSISNLAQLPYEFRFQGTTTPDKVVLDAVVENHLGELSRYLDRLSDVCLWPYWSPSIRCPMDGCSTEQVHELGIRRHMEACHGMDAQQAVDLHDKMLAEKECEMKESIARKRHQLALDNA